MPTQTTTQTQSDCFICDELIADGKTSAARLHQALYHEGDDND